MRFGKFIILLVFTLSSLCSFGERHNFCDECDEFGCMEKYIDEFKDGVHYVYTAHLHERRYHDENDEIHICHDLVDAYFDLIWHELDASIPEVVTLPTKLRVNLPEYNIDEVIKLNTWVSDYFYSYTDRLGVPKDKKCRIFNTIFVPKDYYIHYDESRTPDFYARKFVFEEGYDDRCVKYYDDVIFKGEIDDNGNLKDAEIIYFPWPYENGAVFVSPSFMVESSSDTYPEYREELPYSCKKQEIPFVFNREVELNDPKAYSLPYFDPENTDRCLDIYYPWTFGRHIMPDYEGAWKIYYSNTGIYAIIFRDEYEKIGYEKVYDFYDLSRSMKPLKYVQWNTSVLPEIDRSKVYDYQLESNRDKLLEEKEIVTFVHPDLVDGFKELQSKMLFPANAKIEPFRDMIYLYPELQNGKWVKGQSKYYCEFCKFGNATVADVRWETSDSSIATVDLNGIVTSLQPGEVEVRCILTDNNGEEYVATSTINIDDKILLDVEEISDCRVPDGGVYNLQGIKVSDTFDKNVLPKGLYIVGGKKVMI